MFEKQLDALKKAIRNARQIECPQAAINEFTKIIQEKIISKNKSTQIQALLFLDDNVRAEVYALRAQSFRQLANVYKNKYDNAQGYIKCASNDTLEALAIFNDENKRNRCKLQLLGDKETILSLKELSATPKKRKRSESNGTSNALISPIKYQLRTSIWQNPKQAFEKLMTSLDAEQADLYSPKKAK